MKTMRTLLIAAIVAMLGGARLASLAAGSEGSAKKKQLADKRIELKTKLIDEGTKLHIALIEKVTKERIAFLKQSAEERKAFLATLKGKELKDRREAFAKFHEEQIDKREAFQDKLRAEHREAKKAWRAARRSMWEAFRKEAEQEKE